MQSFGFHGFLHFRTRGDARLEFLEAGYFSRPMFRKMAQLSTVKRYESAIVNVSPVRYFLPASCWLVHSNFFVEIVQREFFTAGSARRIPQRREALVHFARDVVEPFLHAVTLERAVLRRQAGLRLLVGEVLHDRTPSVSTWPLSSLSAGTAPLELMAK